MLFIGIDPALRSGAVGCIDHHGAYIGGFEIQTMLDDRIDPLALRRGFIDLIDKRDAMFCIEDVFVRSGQGMSSSAKFMRACGSIEATAHLMNMPVLRVFPQKWKKAMGLTSEKEDSLVMARDLWPSAPLARKKDNNLAEAILLAEFARRNYLD